MKMYFEYINNFDESIRIVEKWQQKEGSGSRFLKSRVQDERHSQLNLLGYLLLPVQRVPRYRLLLADLVNSSDAPSNRLRSGYEKVEGLAREINDRKAEMEGRKRLVDLERTVISPPTTPSEEEAKSATTLSKFVDPARRLVKENSLNVLVRRKKVHGGLIWEKPLEQKCLAVSCSDKLFLVLPSSSHELMGSAHQVKMLPLNPFNCRFWQTFPSKTQWQLDAGNPPPNGVLSSSRTHLLLLNPSRPSVARLGDSDVTAKTMFPSGSMRLAKPPNGSVVAKPATTTFLLVFSVYLLLVCFARNKK